MSTVYRMEYPVDSRDVDLFGLCRPSAVLGMLQEAATQAAMELHASGPEVLEKYNALWMVSRNWVELYAPLRWNDRLVIETWHRGAERASSWRDFDLFRDGTLVGQGVTQWVMVDAHEHKLMRMNMLEEFVGTDGGERCKTIKPRRAPMPEEYDGRTLRAMGYSDTDINGHINNIHYADFACDALHLEKLCRGRFVRGIHLDYITECMAGETLTLDTAARGDLAFARGVGEDGTDRFHCALTLSDI